MLNISYLPFFCRCGVQSEQLINSKDESHSKQILTYKVCKYWSRDNKYMFSKSLWSGRLQDLHFTRTKKTTWNESAIYFGSFLNDFSQQEIAARFQDGKCEKQSYSSWANNYRLLYFSRAHLVMFSFLLAAALLHTVSLCHCFIHSLSDSQSTEVQKCVRIIFQPRVDPQGHGCQNVCVLA